MKKFLFAAMALGVASVSFAQEAETVTEEVIEYSADKYKVETNRFWDNWFVSVGAGGQVYFGDHDKQAKFGDRIAPALDVAFGKWFTPGIGVRVMYSGLQIKGATKHPGDSEDSSHGTGKPVQGGGAPHWLEQQKFNMGNVHADVMFNLVNLFGGYRADRKWECSPYLGVGYAMCYDSPSTKEVSANLGVFTSWNFCKAMSLNLDVRSMYVSDNFDGEGGGTWGEGLLTATIGLSYKFPNRGWDRARTVYRTVYNNGDLNAMREKLNQLNAENEALKKALADGNNRDARTIVRKIAAANLVVFPLDKATLSKEAKANLSLLAEVIKSADSDEVYTITGYADKGTGSVETNEKLSQRRAEAVYDFLVSEGVAKKQLKVDYKGGVSDLFYNDPRLSRAVITRGN